MIRVTFVWLVTTSWLSNTSFNAGLLPGRLRLGCRVEKNRRKRSNHRMNESDGLKAGSSSFCTLYSFCLSIQNTKTWDCVNPSIAVTCRVLSSIKAARCGAMPSRGQNQRMVQVLKFNNNQQLRIQPNGEKYALPSRMFSLDTKTNRAACGR